MRETTNMETRNTVVVATPSETAKPVTAIPLGNRYTQLLALLRRRGLWVIAAVMVIATGALIYHWTFGTAKVTYATAAVQRGDVESTVVAAGVLQPVKYVDIGAQTSSMLKSLKVQRGDHVEANQLLAEIDPVLAETALTSADATLQN